MELSLRHIPADLAPHVKIVITIEGSLATIAQTCWEHAYKRIELFAFDDVPRETKQGHNMPHQRLIKAVHERSSVPQAVHDGLNVCTTKFEKQGADLALLYISSKPSPDTDSYC